MSPLTPKSRLNAQSRRTRHEPLFGPGSATDHAIARWNGTGGDTLQDSLVTINDAGNLITPGTISATGSITGGNFLSSGTLAIVAAATHTLGWGACTVRLGSAAEYIANDGAGTLTIAAATAVAITQNLGITGNITVSGTVDGVDVGAHAADTSDPHGAAMSVSTSLTCPSLIGGTAANATLLLTASSHGTPSGDVIEFKTEGSRLMQLSGDVTAHTHSLVLGAATPTGAFADQLIVTTDAWWSILACYTHSGTAGHHASFRLARSRGTAASPTTVVSGDTLASLSFAGYTNAYYGRARIDALVDGAASGTTIPTSLLFKTGTTSLLERMRISSDGTIQVAYSNHLAFYSASHYIHGASAELTLRTAGTLSAQATTAQNWDIGATPATEMQLVADTLNFITTGADPNLYWGASATQLDLRTGITARFSLDGTGISFFAAAPVAQQDIVGARDVPEEAFADLLTKLALTGLFTDSTTAS